MANDGYVIIPPVLSVTIEDSMDIMIARDTARRAASLLGFVPSFRAQLAGASGALAELVLKTGTAHELRFNGIQTPDQTGVQVSCEAPWLADVAAGNVELALREKLGDLVDEIKVAGESPPSIALTMWLYGPRKIQAFDSTDSDIDGD